MAVDHHTQARQRKKRSNTTKTSGTQPITPENERIIKHEAQDQQDGDIHMRHSGDESAVRRFLVVISLMIGVTLAILSGVQHVKYIRTIHENYLWFSNIKEVEREISFRTESGLYYSYYKQMVQASSISQGLYELTHDNNTEHLNTINLLARMNIHQEVLLSIIYKSSTLVQGWFEPVYFYLDCIFSLHGLLVAALYGMAWLLSGTWVAGVLAAAFYILNKEDTTRVAYVVPLRESFALPFLWLQLAAITCYFKPHISPSIKRLSVLVVAVSTFCFSITWQFNQFILLLQAMALFGTQVLQLVPHHKIKCMYLVEFVSLVLVSVLQYGNTMIFSGLVTSFIPAALIVMSIQRRMHVFGVLRRSVLTVFFIILVFGLTILFNTTIKLMIHQEADEHIYRFIMSKFGLLPNPRDFDVQLYLCNGAFTFLGRDVYTRLSQKLVFPVYVFVHAAGIVALLVAFFQQSRGKADQDKSSPSFSNQSRCDTHVLSERPDLAYHLIQAVFFGVLAITTLRMKYLWTPYMCVLAAALVSDYRVWRSLLRTINCDSHTLTEIIRHVWALVLLGGLLYVALPPVWKELEDLREFYDPDTVDLMEWIKKNTPVSAAFTGSMQLLAGVKLCTNRPISNHPHYEDKALRLRTKELYQVYGRSEPEHIHHIMKKYDISYLILEDSICLAPSHDGCRLPDIIDVNNGQIPDNGVEQIGLVKSSTPRFCNQIRYAQPSYVKYFKSVFVNRTFRVYRIVS